MGKLHPTHRAIFAGELGLAQVAGRRSGRSQLGPCAVQPARRSSIRGFCTTPPPLLHQASGRRVRGGPALCASVVLIEPGSM